MIMRSPAEAGQGCLGFETAKASTFSTPRPPPQPRCRTPLALRGIVHRGIAIPAARRMIDPLALAADVPLDGALARSCVA